MKYRYQAVDRIPRQLQPDIVYHSDEFELGALLCACGCGHRINLLVPDSHRITSEAGAPTIRPSIAVCDGPCKSHYIITGGRVEWLPAYSAEAASALMQRQIARHAASDPKRLGWFAVLLAPLLRLAAYIKSLFPWR
jgi:hypothetical protein